MTSLAIAVPQIGLTSETFIRRHVESLLPGRTVVLTREASGPSPGWQTRRPVLTPTAATGAWRRLVRSVERARGLPPDAARTRRFLTRHQVEAVMGEYLDFSLGYLAVSRRVRALLRARPRLRRFRAVARPTMAASLPSPERSGRCRHGQPPEP